VFRNVAALSVVGTIYFTVAKTALVRPK